MVIFDTQKIIYSKLNKFNYYKTHTFSRISDTKAALPECKGGIHNICVALLIVSISHFSYLNLTIVSIDQWQIKLIKTCMNTINIPIKIEGYVHSSKKNVYTPNNLYIIKNGHISCCNFQSLRLCNDNDIILSVMATMFE